MFMRFFRSLMPHDERFIQRFTDHSRLIGHRFYFRNKPGRHQAGYRFPPVPDLLGPIISCCSWSSFECSLY